MYLEDCEIINSLGENEQVCMVLSIWQQLVEGTRRSDEGVQVEVWMGEVTVNSTDTRHSVKS